MIETTEIFKNSTDSRNTLPAPLKPLQRLAWNYWWSWAADGESIFRDLDPKTWEECEQNPRQLLARTSSFRFAQVATDPLYLERVRRLTDTFETYIAPAPSRQFLRRRE